MKNIHVFNLKDPQASNSKKSMVHCFIFLIKPIAMGLGVVLEIDSILSYYHLQRL